MGALSIIEISALCRVRVQLHIHSSVSETTDVGLEIPDYSAPRVWGAKTEPDMTLVGTNFIEKLEGYEL
jgi:hypothetical protein